MKKHRRRFLCLLLTLLTVFMPSAVLAEALTEDDAASDASIQEQASKATVKVYRLYNPTTGEHLYTTDYNEKTTLYNDYDWGYEGIAWYSATSGTPVYRLYQPGLGNHLYTTDANEVAVLTRSYGWKKDNSGKPLFYSSGSVPIYRVYNAGLKGLHHLTTDYNEYKTLPKYGWAQEGVKIYAEKLGEPITTEYRYPAVGNYGFRAGKPTIRNFLAGALQPVGSTLYVYGGGWNEADTGAGTEAVTIGVSSQWKKFYNQNNASYDWTRTKFQIHNGLDCSGYVGWAVYNVMNTKSGNAGYVYGADQQAAIFASKGLGTTRSVGSSSTYRAGDIVSMDEHVYIVIGQCSDGSIVFMHASPPGVMISGTRSSSGGSTEATRLAEAYMKKYFSSYYSRYASQITRSSAYKSGTCFSWSSSVLDDSAGLRNMNAHQVLKTLLGDV